MGRGNDFSSEIEFDDTEENVNLLDNNTSTNNEATSSYKYVRKMNHESFRNKLVNHFDILFLENKIKWPTRDGTFPVNI